MKIVMLIGTLALTCCLVASPAAAQFVEDDVEVLQVFRGEGTLDGFGWACEDIPDIDGDGVRELLISAVNFNGRFTLYSGATGEVLNDVVGVRNHGYALNEAGDVNADGVADYIVGGFPVAVYSGADQSVIWDLSSIVGFGHAVGGAGDIDHDGHDDLIVGSERTFPNLNDGEVFVISGRTGAIIWKRDGGPGENLGSAVGNLGDVNGDGVPDVVVGAQSAGPNQGGEAYVYSGVDGALIHTLRPAEPERAAFFGQFFASGAGDVDGDGVGDAFVGDYAGLGGAGETYIFSGATGETLHRFTGFDADDGFGPGRGVPDVNGDGHADILIGAFFDGDGAPAAGKAYLFSGRSGALLRTITSTRAGVQFGVDAISTGDTNGDGLTDYLITAAGESLSGTGIGETYLIAGTKLPCPADLNGNRWVGVGDFFRLLRYIRRGNLDGDLNGDREVDSDDISVLIADLGRCPSVKKKKRRRRRH